MHFIKVSIPTGEVDSKKKEIYKTRVLNTQLIWEMEPTENGTELNIKGHLIQVKESIDDILEQINPATSQAK